MRLIFTEPKILVRKATKRKVTRTYKRLSALSTTMGNSVAVNFVKGIRKFKSRISSEKLLDAWKTGNYNKVLEVVPWHQLPEDLAATSAAIGQSAFKASAFVIPSLPAPIEENLRYDTQNPRISNYINSRTGDLVQNIQQDTQDTIQNAVMRSFNEARSPRDVANDIKGSIGLNPRLQNAVTNYRAGLEKGGLMSDVRIESLTNAYYERLLDYRAMMIGRTETRNAVNNGQLLVWQQGADQGLIDRDTARKVWIIDGDPCEICIAMDGVEVGLDEDWEVETDGGIVNVTVPSEIHPHCMCGMELMLGKSEQNIEDNTPDDNQDETQTGEE